MLKFTVLNNQVCLDPNIILIEEFSNILKYAESKGNEKLGNQMLLYIFWCCDLTEDNIMKSLDYRQKPEQALIRAFNGKKKKFTKVEQALIDDAIDAYNYFNEDSLERATLAYDQKIDEIRELLETVKPEVHAVFDDDGNIDKYVSNNKIIADFSKQLSDMATYKLKAKETAKKIENTGRVRGNKGSSLIERGGFRRDQD